MSSTCTSARLRKSNNHTGTHMPPRKPAAPAATETPAPATTETPSAPAAVATREPGDEEVASEVAVAPAKKSALMSLEEIGNLMVEDAEEDLGFGKDDVALPFWRV